MSQAIRKSLLRALQHQDFEGFRSIVRSVGLPRDSSFADYELLNKAVKLGCKRIANLLLDSGARVFKKRGLVTPLHHALTKGDGWSRLVERLLQMGASVSDKNNYGDTPLHVAFAHRASGRIVDMLLRKHLEDSSENLMNKERLSFLHIAQGEDTPRVPTEQTRSSKICHWGRCFAVLSMRGALTLNAL